MQITNDIVIKIAKETGFDLIGFAKAEKLTGEVSRLKNWLANGYQAKMEYMGRNVDKREDISLILPNAKSIISLAVNYYSPEEYSEDSGRGKVSRYAWGKDYHLVIWDLLKKLETKLKDIDKEFESISYVDTGPVMDKAWAVKSGIGWLGKHTNVINKELGSWIFLANIITNYEFDYSEPIPDFCGSCTACMDACPTNAIVDEYIVDSNKCISFLTIENKEDIPDEFDNKLEGWIFGCDICQDVCPWNIKFSQVTKFEEFIPAEGNKELEIGDVLTMTNEGFKKKFSESPIKRAKLSSLQRNANHLKF